MLFKVRRFGSSASLSEQTILLFTNEVMHVHVPAYESARGQFEL